MGRSHPRKDGIMPRLKLVTGLCAAALASLALAPSAMADFTINDLDDPGVMPADGMCDAPGGDQCTLREAVTEANFTPAPDDLTFGIPGRVLLNAAPISITGSDISIDGQGDGNSMFDTIIDGDDATQLVDIDGGINDVSLSDLRLVDGASLIGGAVVSESSLFFQNVTVTSSIATGGADARGGGIVVGNGETLTIDDVVFSLNDAMGTNDSSGGAIYSTGPIIMTDSTISGNDATGGAAQNQAGGVYAEEGFTILNSTFSENTASGAGAEAGGLLGDGNGLAGGESITSSTFSGNTSTATGTGGGAQLGDGTAITNTTFTSNSAGGDPGADLQVTGAGITTTKNTIFGSASACDEVAGATIVPATPVGNNIDVGTSCDFASAGGSSGNQNSTDPLLNPTLTQGTPSEPPSHRPMPLSPAVDMALTDCGPMTDQRGVTKPQGPACDVGSHELDYRDLTVTVNGSGTVTTFLGFPAAINCPPTCAAEFRHGVNVTLLNSPAAGFTFAGYSGDCIGGLCMMVSNRIANAFFAPITPPSGGGGASIPQSTPPAEPPFDLKAALRKCRKLNTADKRRKCRKAARNKAKT
jgi:hypothetical protein